MVLGTNPAPAQFRHFCRRRPPQVGHTARRRVSACFTGCHSMAALPATHDTASETQSSPGATGPHTQVTRHDRWRTAVGACRRKEHTSRLSSSVTPTTAAVPVSANWVPLSSQHEQTSTHLSVGDHSAGHLSHERCPTHHNTEAQRKAAHQRLRKRGARRSRHRQGGQHMT